MIKIEGWQWILAAVLGLGVFVVFSAGYGLFVYLRPPKITSSITPKDFGLAFENVTMTTVDGLKLSAWFLPAQNFSNKTILLLHGYPADKGDILPSTLFLREDYNLLYLDFRYFGQSQGSYSTIGLKEVQDVLAAVDYLKKREQEKVGIWGFSMGGATALMALSHSPQIDAVVSETSYASLALMAEEVYRPLPFLNKLIAKLMVAAAKLFLRLDPTIQSPLLAIRKIKKPVLFIHSLEDEVIPFAHARLLQKASSGNPRAEFWFRERGRHGDLGSEVYNDKIREFFTKHLKNQ